MYLVLEPFVSRFAGDDYISNVVAKVLREKLFKFPKRGDEYLKRDKHKTFPFVPRCSRVASIRKSELMPQEIHSFDDECVEMKRARRVWNEFMKMFVIIWNQKAKFFPFGKLVELLVELLLGRERKNIHAIITPKRF